MTHFEETTKSILGDCSCGEIYKSRKLTAPDCVWCNYSDGVIEALTNAYNLAINDAAEAVRTKWVYGAIREVDNQSILDLKINNDG